MKIFLKWFVLLGFVASIIMFGFWYSYNYPIKGNFGVISFLESNKKTIETNEGIPADIVRRNVYIEDGIYTPDLNKKLTVYRNLSLGIEFSYPEFWELVNIETFVGSKERGQNDFEMFFSRNTDVVIKINKMTDKNKTVSYCSLGFCEDIDMSKEISEISKTGKKFKSPKNVDPYESRYIEKVDSEIQYVYKNRSIIFYLGLSKDEYYRFEIFEKYPIKNGSPSPHVLDLAESIAGYKKK